MRIALDATPLSEPTGGIRRYTLELHNALSPDSTLLHPQDRRWWSSGLPRTLIRGNFDLFHGTDFAVPYLPVKPSVLTLHDLSPWTRREGSPRVRRRTPWLLRLGLATMIITPSEAIRREAIHYFRLPPDEVVAIPLAASSHFRPVDAPPPARPYFLYTGTLEPRKNIAAIVDAWHLVRRRIDADLVLAGRPRPGFQIPPGPVVLGETAENDLPALYSQAIAVLYPSLYEGFGLPVIEAMQCGAPVIASHDPALRELAADACILVDPRDVPAIAAAMLRLAEDPAFRARFVHASLRRAALYSWTATAHRTRDVYRTALRRFHG